MMPDRGGGLFLKGGWISLFARRALDGRPGDDGSVEEGSGRSSK